MMLVRWLIVIILWPTFLAPAAAGQSAVSAKDFLSSIYQLYGNKGHGIPYSPRYIHSSLLFLIHADLKAAQAASEVPWPLDADIACDCQEWDGIWLDKLDVKLEKPERAIVVASFYIYSPENRSGDDRDRREMRYTLLAERGGWRIYDIEDMSRKFDPKEPRSLRRQLRQDIESFKHESR